ncbi:pyrimidine 5'-nucleotidase [Sulfurirhabdus autotrophica]|uniref:Putative hydrolase of the HAD superfamily n=1 Tax=Sulfurirhabdus autotrophica TaxID=1706046 RepID=A0A4R3Y1M8_9PROT|nr:pyrimidine 5'-nucleotidase [Sulfurirhabdus autotrophica]TCV85191.1 putative hydrolase of the HAD superfamily [Sulfurirhabdus autotrophica]
MKSCKTWVFDLDNTLHNASPHIFPHINRAMTDYLKTHLGLEEEEANQLRMQYWHRYGATLSGLIRHHNTDPHHFLWHTHQFPALGKMLQSEKILRHTLNNLPGQKVLFSNAPAHYSQAVLRLLNISDLFQKVFTIESTRFRPKPDSYGFYRLFRQMQLLPKQCIMVEDTLVNLKIAKKLGMKTVWVSPLVKCPSYVDVSVRSVTQLPKMLHHLGHF